MAELDIAPALPAPPSEEELVTVAVLPPSPAISVRSSASQVECPLRASQQALFSI